MSSSSSSSSTPQNPNPTTAHGAGNGQIDDALDISIIVFMCIALYNALELTVLIPLSFRRYNTLYFWSLLTSTILGVIPFTLTSALQFFSLEPLWLTFVLQNASWILMVPNQSVVLYSRLHLVSQNTTLLALVRGLILLSLLGIVVPTIVLNAGWTFLPRSATWTRGYDTMERIQVTWFTAQECFISGVYIWHAVRLIGLIPSADRRRQKILYELLGVNVIAIILDLAVVVLQYLDYYFAQVVFKATVYSVKLKLEFAVLGLLVSIVYSHEGGEGMSFWQLDQTTSGFD